MTNESSLGHFPSGKWSFDSSVANVFPDMLRRSIPDYEHMRKLVAELGIRFAKPDTNVVDLGCSRGDGIRDLYRYCGTNLNYFGVDNSQSMIEIAKENFKHEIEVGFMSFSEMDLCNDYPHMPTTLTLAVLTLQFIPLEHRKRIIADAYKNLLPGGAFIVVEKIVCENDLIQDKLTAWYEDMKHANGYTREEIAKKKESLIGVMTPIKPSENIKLLSDAGFTVDCFWRCMNFAGFLAVK